MSDPFNWVGAGPVQRLQDALRDRGVHIGLTELTEAVKLALVDPPDPVPLVDLRDGEAKPGDTLAGKLIRRVADEASGLRVALVIIAIETNQSGLGTPEYSGLGVGFFDAMQMVRCVFEDMQRRMARP